MTSWLEELERRETVARGRAEELREQMAELREQLAAAEQQLSRLAITRETMLESCVRPARLAGCRRKLVSAVARMARPTI
ncbi:hypothetical protein [Nocardia sp. NPDC051570]|uniref:hypothetical protein n=1 Tax=Nocardia sp. NPDC051570 TaxID=3364324 RepID=UPI0037B2909C